MFVLVPLLLFIFPLGIDRGQGFGFKGLRRDWENPSSSRSLLSKREDSGVGDLELLDEGDVPLEVGLPEVPEEPLSLADDDEELSQGAEVLPVLLHVLREVRDGPGEDRHC